MSQANVSVLILTLNEEINLPACLETLSWCDDIVVFDSFSTDRTEQIAKDFGAKFVQREFDNYAAQRNAALNDVDYKYPWVFMLDADERVPQALVREVVQAAADADDDVVLFQLRRKDMFMGRWLKGSSGYPTWFGRLIRLGFAEFQREVHEHCFPKGRTGQLQEHMIHYPFSKGLGYWFERHNLYSTTESAIRRREMRKKIRLQDLLAANHTIRRGAFKKFVYRLPLRPLIVFLYFYVWRRGIFDRKAGLIYCLLRSVYEYMIDIKIVELRRRAKNLPL